MTNLIPRYHLLMSREDFMRYKRTGHFNGFFGDLSYGEVECTTERFLPLFHKVGQPWSWDNIAKYRDIIKLNTHLESPSTRLFHLLDNLQVIGYCLLTDPSNDDLETILKDYTAKGKVAEIENLGLFPSQAGKGRGFKFFEMVLKDLFKENEYVYWSMTSTNHPRLFDFYTKTLGMKLIATTYAPNPTMQEETEQQAA